MTVLICVLVLGGATRMVAEEAEPSRAAAEVRGTTTAPRMVTGHVDDEGDMATPGRPLSLRDFRRHDLGGAMEDSGWVLIDSETFDFYIPVGEAGVIRFENSGDSLVIIPPPELLTALAALLTLEAHSMSLDL